MCILARAHTRSVTGAGQGTPLPYPYLNCLVGDSNLLQGTRQDHRAPPDIPQVATVDRNGGQVVLVQYTQCAQCVHKLLPEHLLSTLCERAEQFAAWIPQGLQLILRDHVLHQRVPSEHGPIGLLTRKKCFQQAVESIMVLEGVVQGV
jgi:hypothetical protein